jgi:hypothetical protein
MAAKKTKPQNLNRLRIWTPLQAAEWSGMRYRLLLRFCRDGRVPCIVSAPSRLQTATSRRIFLIPAEPFKQWLKTIPPPGRDRGGA